MTQSFLPKPLLYKEWKEHKWWLLVGVVLLLYSPVSHFLGVLVRPSLQGFKQGMIWRVIFPVLYHFQFTLNSSNLFYPSNYVVKGPPTMDTMAAVVAMGLMIALVSVERSRGSMWYTFSLPIRRIDALRVKVALVLSAVMGSLLLNFVLLLISDVIANRVVPLWSVVFWFFENALLELSLMAVGLATATVITTGLLAGLSAVLLSGTPWALGSAVLPAPLPGTESSLTQSTTLVHASTTAGHIAVFLRGLSPIHYAVTGMTQTSGPLNSLHPLVIPLTLPPSLTWWAAVWLTLWTVVWGGLGIYGYLRAPFEHQSSFLQFPRLSPFVLWLLYGFVSLVIANTLSVHHNQTEPTPYSLLIRWVLIWIVFGAAATVFGYIRRRYRQAASV